MFESFVHDWALLGATLLDALAALIVIVAALRAVIKAAFAARLKDTVAQVAPVRQGFSVWLALALEVLIGSDIIRTAVSPNWTEIAQLTAVVILRVVINYTLLQDVKESE